ncbi:hypothetical protein LguiB_016103 [Lonicera macranthoides]
MEGNKNVACLTMHDKRKEILKQFDETFIDGENSKSIQQTTDGKSTEIEIHEKYREINKWMRSIGAFSSKYPDITTNRARFQSLVDQKSSGSLVIVNQ